MSTLDDLKHEFLLIQDCVGVDFESFNETRQREVFHSINRMDATVLPLLERGGIDTYEFYLIFDVVKGILVNIQKLRKDYESYKDSDIKNKIDKLYYNLKAVTQQVNSQVQDFILPEGYSL